MKTGLTWAFSPLSVLQSKRFFQHRFSCFLLSFCWLLGLTLGSVFMIHSISLSWMRRIFFDPVSIVGCVFSCAFPFLITAFVVMISAPWILFFCSLVKGFVFASVSLYLIYLYSDAGWLVRFLLMFSEVFSIPALYMCWRRSLISKRRSAAFVCLGWFSFSAFLNAMELYYIHPLLLVLDIL